jgi:hypothetical protein
MPKDESDPEDPLELCGVGLLTHEDTSEMMAECFIEEFLRLGYDHRQVLALFRNRHYTGMNMVLENRGEEFVKAKITEVFGWWKREAHWEPTLPAESVPPADAPPRAQETECDAGATDPTGAALPQLRY